MLKLFERNLNVVGSASFICLLLLITNISLLAAENYLAASFRNLLLLLYFNFALSMTIIMYHHNLLALRYSTLSTYYKTNDYKIFSSEFLKLSGIFLLAILASSISIKWIPLKMVWISDYVSYLVCTMIMLRWNSNEFIEKFIVIICKMFRLNFSEEVDFVEVIVADVWTSFTRPFIVLVNPEYKTIRAIILW